MATDMIHKETKSDKFVRLAEQRVNLIIEQFRKLGNLSNTRNYDYTDEQVKKIFSELNKALRKTKTIFNENSNTKPTKFKL